MTISFKQTKNLPVRKKVDLISVWFSMTKSKETTYPEFGSTSNKFKVR